MFDLPAIEITDTVVSSLPDAFTDISGHPSAYAINTLASLDILNTQTNMFYPDNYLRHYDFIILFVNSLLHIKAQSLGDGIYASFADVGGSASYLPQLSYAADRGLIDYIITNKKGQLYFEPNSFMTKHEVYQMLTKAFDVQFSYDPQEADMEKMTRGELAHLLVQSLDLQPEIASSDSADEDATLLNKLKVLLSLL